MVNGHMSLMQLLNLLPNRLSRVAIKGKQTFLSRLQYRRQLVANMILTTKPLLRLDQQGRCQSVLRRFLAQCMSRWSIVITMAMKGVCTVADLTRIRFELNGRRQSP